MEFEKIEKLIKSIETDLHELRFVNTNSTLLKDKIKQSLIQVYEEVNTVDLEDKKTPEPELSNMYIAQPEVSEPEVTDLEPEVSPDPKPEMELEPAPEVVEVPEPVVQENTVKVEINQVQMSMPMEEDFSFDTVEEEIVQEEENIESNQMDMGNAEFEVQAPKNVEFESMSIVQKHRVEQNDVMEGFKNKPLEKLSSSIPIGKKFEFIEDLFIGNSEEYQRAIQNIDSMAGYKEAEEFLMINYFDKFDWTEKEKVLNSLFDYVTRRFAA